MPAFSADGSEVLYATYIGGSGFDKGPSPALPESGDMVAAGQSTSPDFPIANGFDDPLNGGVSAVNVKLTRRP